MQFMGDKKIRVLHVIGIMNYGGAETMIMNLFRKIDRNKFQFDFLIHGIGEGDYDQEIKKLGGCIFSLPEYKIYNFSSYRKACKKFFSTHPEYDIVHGHIESCASIYLDEARKLGIYTIAHTHSTGFQALVPKMLYNILTFKTRYIADYFFACSRQAGENRFGSKTVESNYFLVFNNGIDVQEYIYTRNRHENLKKNWNMQGKFVIGHVGRMSKEKNHVFLVHVFSEMCKREKNAVLILVGDGAEKKNIENLVCDLGLKEKVIFTGNRKDIPEIMNLFDVFVFPSIYEGLGIALIEAQAAGLPCVVADTIVDEAILSDEVKSLSLNDTYKTWVDKIMKFSTYVEKRKDNYNLIIEKGFDIRNTTKKLEKFYAEKALR